MILSPISYIKSLSNWQKTSLPRWQSVSQAPSLVPDQSPDDSVYNLYLLFTLYNSISTYSDTYYITI
jgi:hypothetical protein